MEDDLVPLKHSSVIQLKINRLLKTVKCQATEIKGQRSTGADNLNAYVCWLSSEVHDPAGRSYVAILLNERKPRVCLCRNPVQKKEKLRNN